MKCLRVVFSLFFLSFVGISNFLRCMELSEIPNVIIFNGVSCSGKTSIAQACMEMVDPSLFSLVSADGIKMRVSEDLDEEHYRDTLHNATIKKIKSELERGRRVICDTVLDDRRWVELFKQELSEFRILFVFVHCPLNILAQRLKERNQQARAEGRSQDQRIINQVLITFGRMYERVDSDCALGSFSEQEFEFFKRKGVGAQVSPKHWMFLKPRFEVFDVDKMRVCPFLKLNFQEEYSFILNNYSDELPKDEFIRTLAERVIGLF